MRTTIALVAALFMVTRAASADPITVSVNAARVHVTEASGSIDVWRQSPGPIIDVDVHGVLADRSPFLQLCQACRSGEMFDATIVISGDLGTGSATLGDWRNPTHRWTNLRLDGEVTLTTGSLVLPGNAPALYNVFLPLTISGFLTGSVNGDEVLRVLPFSFHSQAHVQFRTRAAANGGRVFTVQLLDYIGSDIPPAVPEPTTMLLVGSGLAALAWRSRRRPAAQR